MLNSVNIIGRLAKDPDEHMSKNGNLIWQFALGCKNPLSKDN